MLDDAPSPSCTRPCCVQFPLWIGIYVPSTDNRQNVLRGLAAANVCVSCRRWPPLPSPPAHLPDSLTSLGGCNASIRHHHRNRDHPSATQLVPSSHAQRTWCLRDSLSTNDVTRMAKCHENRSTVKNSTQRGTSLVTRESRSVLQRGTTHTCYCHSLCRSINSSIRVAKA